MAVRREARERLLKLVSSGYPVPTARVKVGLTKAQVDALGPGFAARLQDALEEGRAVVTGILIERGLGGDTTALRLALDQGAAAGALEAGLERLDADGLAALVRRLSAATRDRLYVALLRERPPLFGELSDEELCARLLAKRAARARDMTERPAAVERRGVADGVPTPFGRGR